MRLDLKVPQCFGLDLKAFHLAVISVSLTNLIGQFLPIVVEVVFYLWLLLTSIINLSLIVLIRIPFHLLPLLLFHHHTRILQIRLISILMQINLASLILENRLFPRVRLLLFRLVRLDFGLGPFRLRVSLLSKCLDFLFLVLVEGFEEAFEGGL